MKVREIVKLVEADGWAHVRTEGSHRHVKHPATGGGVTIAVHRNEDLKPATERSTLRQAGFHIEMLREHGEPVPLPTIAGAAFVRVAA